MLNLRVTKCNNQWDKIVALTKTEFKKPPDTKRKFGMHPRPILQKIN